MPLGNNVSQVDLVVLDRHNEQYAELPPITGPISTNQNLLGDLTLDLGALKAEYHLLVSGANPGDAALDMKEVDQDDVTFVWPDEQTSLRGLMIIVRDPKSRRRTS